MIKQIRENKNTLIGIALGAYMMFTGARMLIKQHYDSLPKKGRDYDLVEISPSLAREGILEMICRENPGMKKEDLLNGDFVRLYEITLEANHMNENTQISPLKKYAIPHLLHR